VFLLLVIDSNGGNLYIKNNSDLKLEYVKAYFVNAEGPITDEIKFENMKANKKSSYQFSNYDFSNNEANLEIRFKFENSEELFVDAGIFNDKFDGNINIVFDQKEDNKLTLKVKASKGILPSNAANCNENFKINLKEGYIE
jgi:hypothetical protein